jgi:hypothetical protein
VSDSVSEQLVQLRQRGGLPLPRLSRRDFEARFGHDFGHVRIHDGEAPAIAARKLRARAFTLGNDVVFGKGQYQPNTVSGKRLLAHELSHVVQQRGQCDSVVRREELIDAPELEMVPKESVAPGIDLPKVAADSPSVDVRKSVDYVEPNIAKLGFGIYEAGYHLWVGRDESHLTILWKDVDLLSDEYFVADNTVYESEAAALAATRGNRRAVAYYRGRYGLKYPTKFCKATTPRFVQLALQAQADYRKAVQAELAGLAVSMLGGKLLGFAYNKAQTSFRGPVPKRNLLSEPSESTKTTEAATAESKPRVARPATPKAQLPNGEWIPPDSYSGGYHGTNIPAKDAAIIRAKGLPARGNDWNLERHAAIRGNPDSAFRGTTALPSDPVTGNGAAAWAGEGNCVVKIEGVPTWDVNKALAGRIRGPDGRFGNNPVHGENEFAIPAEVPPSKIVRIGVVKALPSGRLTIEWLD